MKNTDYKIIKMVLEITATLLREIVNILRENGVNSIDTEFIVNNTRVDSPSEFKREIEEIVVENEYERDIKDSVINMVNKIA